MGRSVAPLEFTAGRVCCYGPTASGWHSFSAPTGAAVVPALVGGVREWWRGSYHRWCGVVWYVLLPAASRGCVCWPWHCRGVNARSCFWASTLGYLWQVLSKPTWATWRCLAHLSVPDFEIPVASCRCLRSSAPTWATWCCCSSRWASMISLTLTSWTRRPQVTRTRVII